MATQNGNQVGHWLAQYDWSTSSTDTATTITITGGFKSTGWGYQLTGVDYNLCIKDTHWTGSGNVSIGYAGTNRINFASNKSVSITRTHEAQSIYTGIWIGNYTGYESGESYGECYVTVPAKPSYTVAYNANGGSGAPGSQTKWYGETLTLSSTKPTKANARFLGWATSNTATSASVQPGGTYTGNAAVTYYAVWQATRTVTYNANGHGTAPSAQTVDAGKSVTLGTISASGYRFDGWYTAATGGTKAGGSGASYTPSGNVTLYAHWTQFWTISFNANNGTGAPGSQTKYKDTALTLSSGKPTRTGYVFQGWGTSSTATSASYQPGGTYPAANNAAATLYAVWKVAYIAPKVTSASAVRTTSATSTANDAAGGYVYAKFVWSVDTTATSGNKSKTITIRYKKRGTSTWEDGTVAGTAVGAASGTSTCNFAADGAFAYDVEFSLTDTSGNSAATVTKTAGVGLALVPLDIQNKGKRIGIMSKAPATDGTISMGGTMLAPPRGVSYVNGAKGQAALYQPKSGETQWAPAVTMQTNGGGSWQMGNYDNENLQFVYFTKANIDDSKNTLTHNFKMRSDGYIETPKAMFTSTQDASGTANSKPALIVGGTDTQAHIEIDANEIMAKANGTSTADLYVNTDGGLVYFGEGIHTGSSARRGYVSVHSDAIDQDVAPSGNVYVQPMHVYDKSSVEIGHIEWGQNAGRTIFHNFAAVRQTNANGNMTWYQCSMHVSPTGAVSYTIHTPSAFRSAIGLANSSASGSSHVTMKNSHTFYAFEMRKNDTTVMFRFTFTNKSAFSSYNGYLVATLNSSVPKPPFDMNGDFGWVTKSGEVYYCPPWDQPAGGTLALTVIYLI